MYVFDIKRREHYNKCRKRQKDGASGLYAQQMATFGFVALAFDLSFGGESGGEVRGTASPEIFTEDYSTAVDYIGLLEMVDRERIGGHWYLWTFQYGDYCCRYRYQN